MEDVVEVDLFQIEENDKDNILYGEDEINDDIHTEKLVSKVPTEKLHWYDNPKYNDGLHYSPKNALSHNADYYFTNGGRSNGKTTGWQLQFVDDYFSYGDIFGKVVRKYEFDPSVALQWFNQIVRDYVKEVYHHELTADRTNFYLIPEEGEPDRYLPLEEGQRVPRLNMKLFGMQFNLALENDKKSHDFQFIKKLVFEEYTLINQYDYLPKEVEHFASLLSTINRERDDLYVVFIGNTISKHNPYFDWLGINVNTLKLAPGEFRELVCSEYEDGARIFVEMIPTVYGDKIKCPRILRVGNNTIATTGDWVISEYVVDETFDEFINGLQKRFNFAIRTNNKMYYHFTCTYKNTTFNIITSRVKKIKSSGCIFEYDLKEIERIKNGSMCKTLLFEQLSDVMNYETLFSDDEIEYKFNKLLDRR